ncbi:biopolymer transport protein ExbD/TolR [Antarctobacter heliothermus]|uniref:Biopolymer transport protein ExbD/TolR n=1 Tax=Antarctobacter heliothermus TaxID=74033 RepID=A0A222E9K3_9RHOB|nr:biopolymer transporter ExbD [Antarctobacter heliothermus]ASP22885.1 biopolymer transport protein ExbD/TolR [Antarctobacter heliothermus]
MLNLPTSPRRRRPSLTPMIDVVFLLLVFFMLVARFGGTDGISLLLSAPGEETPYSGPPRLVSVLPDGLALNGQTVSDLPAALAPLMTTQDDLIVIRPVPGTGVARLVEVLNTLREAGFARLAVVE